MTQSSEEHQAAIRSTHKHGPLQQAADREAQEVGNGTKGHGAQGYMDYSRPPYQHRGEGGRLYSVIGKLG